MLQVTGFSQAYPGSRETCTIYFPMPGTPGGDWNYQVQQMTDWPDLGPSEVQRGDNQVRIRANSPTAGVGARGSASFYGFTDAETDLQGAWLRTWSRSQSQDDPTPTCRAALQGSWIPGDTHSATSSHISARPLA